MKNLEERKTFGNIRPVHKARIAAEKLAATLNAKHPEPMSLMHKRVKQGEVPSDKMWELHPHYHKPEVTLGKKEKVATAVAAWDNSDPFAYGRAYLHVTQGYIAPEDTIKEAVQATIVRRRAKIKEVEHAKALGAKL